MQLQIALDRLPLSRAVELTTQIRDSADWIEAGTSLIKRYGLLAIEEIVAAACPTPVLADIKTADDARSELLMFFAAGASSATVLGAAELTTVERAVETAAEQGAEIVIDLLATDDQRRNEICRRVGGQSHVVMALHVGKDRQAAEPSCVPRIGAWPDGIRVAVAGGLCVEDVPRIRRSHPDVRLIVGSSITAAPDPRIAAAEMYAAVRRPQQKAIDA